jgi:hypothetical protein
MRTGVAGPSLSCASDALYPRGRPQAVGGRGRVRQHRALQGERDQVLPVWLIRARLAPRVRSAVAWLYIGIRVRHLTSTDTPLLRRRRATPGAPNG